MSDVKTTGSRLMKVADLREAIAGIPDDAKVTIELNADGSDTVIENIEVSSRGGYTYPSGIKTWTVRRICITEIPTREKRFDDQIRLGLHREFHKFCKDRGVTPEHVLYGFMADLADIRDSSTGMRTNGSDERMYAQQYFDRCEYGWPIETDLRPVWQIASEKGRETAAILDLMNEEGIRLPEARQRVREYRRIVRAARAAGKLERDDA